MTTVATRPPVSPAAPPAVKPGMGRWIRDHLVVFVGALGMLYMFLPIFVVIRFSFNKYDTGFNLVWKGFTFDAWTGLFDIAGLKESLLLSLKIAALSTIAATLIGTVAAFGLVRHRFKGRGVSNVLIFVPMATPEVVVGSSLLVLFVNMGIPLGQITIWIAHTMFCLSFVIVTVKARLIGLDPRLEQAAQDLYANRTQTFLKITLPLILPGVVSAAMLSFSLSFDDFIITNFNAGSEVTFPMFVWGAAKKALPPQINVIGTAMLVIALLLVIVGRFIAKRRAR